MLHLIFALALSPSAGETQFTVQNMVRDAAISEVYFAPDTGEGWGENVILGQQIMPGEALRLDGVRAGSYSVRLIDEYGASCELHGINPVTQPNFAYTPDGCFAGRGPAR